MPNRENPATDEKRLNFKQGYQLAYDQDLVFKLFNSSALKLLEI